MPHGYDYPDLTRMFYAPEEEIFFQEDYALTEGEARSMFAEGRRIAAAHDPKEVEAMIQRGYEHDKRTYEEMRRCREVDPEKKAVFDAFFRRCRAMVEDGYGSIRVQDSYVPHVRDIHIFAGSLFLDRERDAAFLRDLGRVAEIVEIHPKGEGIHLQISIPYYNLNP